MSPRYYFDRQLLTGLLRYRMRPYLADVATYRKDDTMPEIGGKKLATDFGSMMADVRKSIDTAKETVAVAVRELQGEITTGAVNSAKAIRVEAAAVRAGFGELLGNGAPAEETVTVGSSEVGPVPQTVVGPVPVPLIHRDTGDPVK